MITMFWGGTFLAVQYAVSLSGPLFFCRFAFCDRRAGGGPAFAAHSARSDVAGSEGRGSDWRGDCAGVWPADWGLQTISSSKSAFITAMYVPLVPLLQWLCLGRMPGVMSCVGIVLAFIGLILLAGPENNLLALGVGR